MTLFLTLCLVLCLCVIAVIWAWYRDQQIQHAEAFDNWGFWEKTCKAERADLMRQFDGLRLANQKLHETNSELLDQLSAARAEVEHLKADTSGYQFQVRNLRSMYDKLASQLAAAEAKQADTQSRLTTSEARLADAELRIAAAAENLTNQPRVVEDECPF